MNYKRDKYWHIQMDKAGRKDEPNEIEPKKMLKEPEPVIGIGEWKNIQCDNFKHIENGNIVLVRKGEKAIALCEIISDNFQNDVLTQKYVHRNFRKLKILAWAKDYKQPSSKLFSQGTFSSCKRGTKQFDYIDKWLEYIGKMEFTNKCVRLLERKRNIILQGAPGTGKTFSTAVIALKVLGEDVNLADHKAVMERYEALTGKRIFFTTFHQSLDYEDFVEGLKPQVQKNDEGESIGVTYEPEDGIFKQACSTAAEKDNKNGVVLIIDEINRGNVSKVFGELITLLEADKREGSEHPIRVTLPYSKELFSVPKNLYIIGTMNTTDRSTGTIDYALRRRFAFVTLQADASVIEKHYSEPSRVGLKEKALALFNDIKAFIKKPEHLCGDLGIEDLMVGHSYFMADSEEELKDKVEYEILPLIAEYINDGILNVKAEEKKKAFDAWRDLMPILKDKEDDVEEQEEEQ